MTQKSESIEINNFQNFFEIKYASKTFRVFLSLDTKKNLIIISITYADISNKNTIYENSFSFKDISTGIEEFFIPFKNDMIILFKFIERLFIAKLVYIKINYNNSDDYLSLSFYVMMDCREHLIQLTIPKKNEDNSKNSNSNNSSLKSSHYNFDNIFNNTLNKERKNCNSAPLPFFLGETPKAKDDIKDKDINLKSETGELSSFIYKIKKLNYQITIWKNEIKSMKFKEIVFQICEIEENKTKCEYKEYFNLIDFFETAKPYYDLFNYSIDDIYDDFIIIFYNKNYEIFKAKDRIKLYYFIPNIIDFGGKSVFYKLSLFIDKYEEDRTNEEIKIKIENYYIEMYKIIQKEKKNKKKESKNINKYKEEKENKKEEKEKVSKKKKKEENKSKYIIKEEKENKSKKKNKEEKEYKTKHKNKEEKEVKDRNQIQKEKKNKFKIKEEKVIKEEKKEKEEKKHNKENIRNKKQSKFTILKNNIINKIIEEKKQKDEYKDNIHQDNNKEDNNIKEIKKIQEKIEPDKTVYNNDKIIIQKNEINFNIIHSNNNSINGENIPSLIQISEEKNQSINSLNNPKTIDDKNIFKKNYSKIRFGSKSKSQLLTHKHQRDYKIDQIFKPIKKKKAELNENLFINNIPYESIQITNEKILINKIQIQLILNKAFSRNDELYKKKFYINLIYEINNEKINSNINNNIISEFYLKAKNIENVILLIYTQENHIFGGYTKIGFKLNNNNEAINYNDFHTFIFSINKMKTYSVLKEDDYCISCSNEILPEFNRQIIFEKNSIMEGRTGIKQEGFQTEEDYELNMGQEKFRIKYLQLLNISASI